MRNKRLIIIFSMLLAVTIIVLLGSIIFSVKTVNTRCENYSYTNEVLDQSILDNLGISKGKSIFLVNQQEVIDSIEKNVPDVKVINIERKFPNRITVHYIKLFDYYEIASGGYYYSLTHQGRVVEENITPADDSQKILVKSKVTGRQEVGSYLYSSAEKQLMSDIVLAFEQLDLKNEKATQQFSFIDMEYERGSLYIGIAGSKTVIKIDSPSADGLLDKINLGYSTYLSPDFNRSPNEDGEYQMIYVISTTRSMTPVCDYDG